MSSFKRSKILEESDSPVVDEDPYVNIIVSQFSDLKQFYENLYKNTNKEMYFTYLLDIGNSQIKIGCTEDFGRTFMKNKKIAYKRCDIFGVFKTVGGPKVWKMIKQKFKNYIITVNLERDDTEECGIIQCNSTCTPDLLKDNIREFITAIARYSKNVE